ncbi:type II secretion system F family protein [Devosia sp. WQ 349]|uniref:type II secretion system F family protein n=1 Tax=Devosia sp. WQ 349K1 TaxID=2800329 RepID=UPI00190441BD|nr:type II secretion system F family protein [Devosia sp. WQ 349K1]MBK1796273.1 type II secretion system F family protein [Devosia sp. WQ 349K1]
MTTSLLLIILFVVAAGAVALAFVPAAAGGQRAKQRLKVYQGDVSINRRVAGESRVRDNRRKTVQQALKAQQDELKANRRLTIPAMLFQAGMTTTPAAYIRNSIIFGVVLFGLLVVAQVPFYFAAIIAAAGGYLGPRFYVMRKRRKYQDRFLDELPNAIEAIVRGVKTGLPLNDTVRVVAKDTKEPVRSEFGRILDQQAFGFSMQESIQILLERVPLPEVNFFVVVITVQQQSGGNLSEALSNLARVLRNRKKMKAKVKAMSSEAKASAAIIGALPIVVAVLISVVSPAYLAPLFTTPVGNVCLAIAVFMLSAGVFVMHRMVQFEI